MICLRKNNVWLAEILTLWLVVVLLSYCRLRKLNCRKRLKFAPKQLRNFTRIKIKICNLKLSFVRAEIVADGIKYSEKNNQQRDSKFVWCKAFLRTVKSKEFSKSNRKQQNRLSVLETKFSTKVNSKKL